MTERGLRHALSVGLEVPRSFCEQTGCFWAIEMPVVRIEADRDTLDRHGARRGH